MNDYKTLCKKLREEPSSFFEHQAADAIEQLVKERDAAVNDLRMAVVGGKSYPCHYCANENKCQLDCDGALWEWRGVTDDN